MMSQKANECGYGLTFDPEQGSYQKRCPSPGFVYSMRVKQSRKDEAMAFEVLGATCNPFGAMKQADGGYFPRIGLFSSRRVGDPKQAIRQALRVEVIKSQLSKASAESLMRKLVTAKQIAQSLRLIVGRSKDG